MNSFLEAGGQLPMQARLDTSDVTEIVGLHDDGFNEVVDDGSHYSHDDSLLQSENSAEHHYEGLGGQSDLDSFSRHSESTIDEQNNNSQISIPPPPLEVRSSSRSERRSDDKLNETIDLTDDHRSSSDGGTPTSSGVKRRPSMASPIPSSSRHTANIDAYKITDEEFESLQNFDWSRIKSEILGDLEFIITLPQEPALDYESLGPTLPPLAENMPSKTLFLDLDETLAHTSLDFSGNDRRSPDLIFESETDGAVANVYFRPWLSEFLHVMSQYYELVIYTASLKPYADLILDELDPNQLISHRLYRDHCTQYGQSEIFFKDLHGTGRRLEDSVVVDNRLISFGLNIENSIFVSSYVGDEYDTELLQLIPLLIAISKHADVRPALNETYKLKAIVQKFREATAQEGNSTSPASRDEAYRTPNDDSKNNRNNDQGNKQTRQGESTSTSNPSHEFVQMLLQVESPEGKRNSLGGVNSPVSLAAVVENLGESEAHLQAARFSVHAQAVARLGDKGSRSRTSSRVQQGGGYQNESPSGKASKQPTGDSSSVSPTDDDEGVWEVTGVRTAVDEKKTPQMKKSSSEEAKDSTSVEDHPLSESKPQSPREQTESQQSSLAFYQIDKTSSSPQDKTDIDLKTLRMKKTNDQDPIIVISEDEFNNKTEFVIESPAGSASKDSVASIAKVMSAEGSASESCPSKQTSLRGGPTSPAKSSDGKKGYSDLGNSVDDGSKMISRDNSFDLPVSYGTISNLSSVVDSTNNNNNKTNVKSLPPLKMTRHLSRVQRMRKSPAWGSSSKNPNHGAPDVPIPGSTNSKSQKEMKPNSEDATNRKDSTNSSFKQIESLCSPKIEQNGKQSSWSRHMLALKCLSMDGHKRQKSTQSRQGSNPKDGDEAPPTMKILHGSTADILQELDETDQRRLHPSQLITPPSSAQDSGLSIKSGSTIRQRNEVDNSKRNGVVVPVLNLASVPVGKINVPETSMVPNGSGKGVYYSHRAEMNSVPQIVGSVRDGSQSQRSVLGILNTPSGNTPQWGTAWSSSQYNHQVPSRNEVPITMGQQSVSTNNISTSISQQSPATPQTIVASSRQVPFRQLDQTSSSIQPWSHEVDESRYTPRMSVNTVSYIAGSNSYKKWPDTAPPTQPTSFNDICMDSSMSQRSPFPNTSASIYPKMSETHSVNTSSQVRPGSYQMSQFPVSQYPAAAVSTRPSFPVATNDRRPSEPSTYLYQYRSAQQNVPRDRVGSQTGTQKTSGYVQFATQNGMAVTGATQPFVFMDSERVYDNSSNSHRGDNSRLPSPVPVSHLNGGSWPSNIQTQYGSSVVTSGGTSMMPPQILSNTHSASNKYSTTGSAQQYQQSRGMAPFYSAYPTNWNPSPAVGMQALNMHPVNMPVMQNDPWSRVSISSGSRMR